MEWAHSDGSRSDGQERHMLVPIRNTTGETVGEIELRDDIFAAPVSKPLMHQALVRQQANARLGTHSTLTRGEVRGSTRKIYRQKGTGRARHGSLKVNLWPGGGVAHGPKPRSYNEKDAAQDAPRRISVRADGEGSGWADRGSGCAGNGRAQDPRDGADACSVLGWRAAC